ncbi:MAG: PAS domain-containing sensor histidine kinase [Cyclobacteriaceae bacterium]|nr:PAS domain-containing sensor histidine kinase [Cyclobacteriaceae bacterium]
MSSELNQISTVEDLFDPAESTALIRHEGHEINVEWLKEYQSDQTSFYSRYALLNKNILVISSYGEPDINDIKKATKQLEQSHIDKEIVNVDLVWDVRNIGNPGIKVRKAIIQSTKQLSKYWKSRYLVITPKFKTLIRIYKFFDQSSVENLYFADSIEDALNKITSKLPPEKGIEYSSGWSVKDRIALLKKSKEELVDMIESFKKNHEESTNKVLEAIGQITWGGKFKNVEIEVSENDPHFELINTFSLLQQDVGEIIKEFKELNQNLELMVAERIVDFIDKESNLRSILDNSDRLTWLMNTRYELIDYNSEFSNVVNKRYKRAPEINQNVLEIISDEKERRVWKRRFESALNGKPGIYLDQDNYDNQERVFEIKTFPIKEFGKIKGVSVYIEDITELKNSQFRLIEKNRDLQKVNSELDSFVYRVSHDLRAPLTSILGLINLMKIETSHDKFSEYVDLQERSIHKLDLFIKEIMNLSRNSRLGITVSKIDFDELLNEIFESQHYAKTAENVKRIFNVEENISFYTDRQRLSIILNNLISNSLKYVSPHKKESYVKVDVFSVNNECIIKVSDNGIGISEVYLPKIFQMFFRATQDFNGSGLGLYIVKETVEKLKGKITVKSKNRLGTTFKVVLPNMKERYDAAPKIED